ncbi:MAG: TetR/AcrR family transcriptional regulator [Oscillospiraceae bacterium]
MEKKQAQSSLHDQLILAGIKELSEYGVQNFSLRKVANVCGVSCAAPYKHFKDKQTFIAAIIEYIDVKWHERHEAVSQKYPSPIRKQLLEICLEYIRFLVENPNFIAIVMMKHDDFGEQYSALRGQLSRGTYDMVFKYCSEVNMAENVRLKKTFVVRSLVYGAVLMFYNGELAYTPENMAIVAASIDREFDLP